jgi:hypothetical protein
MMERITEDLRAVVVPVDVYHHLIQIKETEDGGAVLTAPVAPSGVWIYEISDYDYNNYELVKVVYAGGRSVAILRATKREKMP